MSEQTIEQKTEAIARRMARERGVPEALWEMFLLDAYHEVYKLPAPDGSFRDEALFGPSLSHEGSQP